MSEVSLLTIRTVRDSRVYILTEAAVSSGGIWLPGNLNAKARPARSVPPACFAKLARMDGERPVSIQMMDVFARDGFQPGLFLPGEVFDAGADARGGHAKPGIDYQLRYVNRRSRGSAPPACVGRPSRAAGKCNPLMEKESGKIKKLQDVLQESAAAAAFLAFFCHIPLQSFRVAYRVATR